MNRYCLQEQNDDKFIERFNLNNSNKFFVKRGFAISYECETKFNTIYLDGAFKGPLFDVKRKTFSLDHHENCIRQITKSSCEQALLFAKYGTFDDIAYDIIGNDPDLDTILAGWILLNVDQIKNSEVFKKILPLILVAGNIDSYGFGFEEITGLSSEIILQEKNRLNWLREDEVKIKSSGEWNNIDYTKYTLSVFNKLDKFIFYNSNSNSFSIKIKNEEYHPLINGKNLLFIEDSRLSIYDAEELFIKDDNSIECIILSDGNGKYTIKLSKIISKYLLDTVWIVLSNAEMLEKRKKGFTPEYQTQTYFTNWGGSSNIGGSPRYSDGKNSFLDKDKIINYVLDELNAQIR